jgi:hypothetical protein
MNLLSLLERLREKPKEVRVQVSFLTALCVTGVVGLLWGVTLPTRLQGLRTSDQTASAEGSNKVGSFFVDTRNSLGQLISATGEPVTDQMNAAGNDNEVNNTPPSSDAYRAGAAAIESPGYNDNPLETQEQVVVPVQGREVRIGTTTSGPAGSQESY